MRDGEPPLRILQVSPPWFAVPPRSYGGTESVVGALARGLTTAGHDVAVLTTGDATTPGEVWHRFDEPPSPQLGDWRVELQHLLNAYRRDLSDFDVIHDHTLLGTAVAAVAAPDVPIVHTLHGPWDDPTSALLGDVADRVSLVAISHDQAGRAPARTSIAGVVHNGIDLSRFPVGGKGGDHLAFVGRSSPEKAPHLAIDVARMLDRRLVMAVKINEPPEREFWREWVQPRLDGRDDVEVVEGADHDRKCRILGGAAVTLFPIQWDEPFGIVPVESNACGTPVVTFARGPCRRSSRTARADGSCPPTRTSGPSPRPWTRRPAWTPGPAGSTSRPTSASPGSPPATRPSTAGSSAAARTRRSREPRGRSAGGDHVRPRRVVRDLGADGRHPAGR